MTVIVGAGLAGACAALWLSDSGPITVLEAERPAAGASSAAAGLVNPLMGRKARPTWRHDEALDALAATLERAGCGHLFARSGLLRPACDPSQAERFRQRAAELPLHASWLDAGTVEERYPDVRAPHGALFVRQGGSIDLSTLVDNLLAASGASVRTDVRVTRVGEDAAGAWAEASDGERLAAEHVLLAPGAGFRTLDALADLPLHSVKGQTARVTRPDELGDFPPLSGAGYVVPDGDTLIVGSTYEHDFDTASPTENAGRQLLAQAAGMVPALEASRLVEVRAGIRVTVPGAVSPQRLPLLGPLPGMPRVWAFTGLGSKGLLTAPLLARELSHYFRQPLAVPPEVSVPIR